MRRSLVQGDDAAHHPFLQTLPRHVRSGKGADPVRRRNHVDARERMAEWGEEIAFTSRQIKRGSKFGAQDVKDFLLAYCACFVAVMAFIS
jgi:hypothetical protein